jgi:transcription elongation GreA/GreB family factor
MRAQQYLLYQQRIEIKRRIRLFKSVMRPATSKILQRLDKGDLSENAEYDAARNARNANCKTRRSTF